MVAADEDDCVRGEVCGVECESVYDEGEFAGMDYKV